MEREILHCDLNNFYASVETLFDPSLASRPTAVCGSVEERHGIVLAKNQLAKRFGILTGEAVWEAKRKCPELTIVPPHHDRYLDYARRVRSIYARYTNLIEPFGIDEAWLDVTGSQSAFGPGPRIADDIRKSVKHETGLTVSVGVSFNKVFAKLGSDLKKPDAVTVIPKETFREQLWSLPASEMLGVGRSTYKQLENLGIHTLGQLAETDPEYLKRKFGKNGALLWVFANGLDQSRVMHMDETPPVKSVGKGDTPRADLTENAQVYTMLYRLAQDVGKRLRAEKLTATSVQVSVRDNTLVIRQFQCPLPHPTRDALTIAQTGYELFRRQYDWYKNIRSLCIRAIRLIPEDAPVQLDMRWDCRTLDRRERIDHVRDVLAEHCGRKVLIPASLLS